MKAIILSRVSTAAQSLDEQTNNLINYAIKDGYSKSNIIIIEDKESGIKLKEEERNGLNKLKEYITNDSSINCVYAWELSRIARQQRILYSIRDFLIDNKIQLKVYEPSFSLLRKDGSIDESANIIFALYASMSEAEMRTKKARFIRAKKAMALNMEYVGGSVLFGYSIDENSKYIIDEKDSKIVRLIYDLYLTGEHSYTSITNILIKEYGYKCSSKNFVMNALSNDAYTGYSEKSFKKTQKRNPRNYPVIIAKHEFDKVRELASKKNNTQKLTENIYYCKGLIVCPCCGVRFSPFISDVRYMCYSKFNPALRKKDRTCNSATIGMNLLDSIVVKIVHDAEISWLTANHTEKIEQLKLEIEQLYEKINVQNELKIKEIAKAERLSDMYIDGNITKKSFDEKNSLIKESIKLIDNNISEFESFISDKEKSIEKFGNVSNNSVIDKIRRNISIYENYTTLLSDIEIYNLVHKHVEKITIENTINSINKLITIYLADEKVFSIKINTRSKEAYYTINNHPHWDIFEFDYHERLGVTDKRKATLERANERRRLTKQKKGNF